MHVALSENDGVGVQFGVALSENVSCTSSPPGRPSASVTWLSWLDRSTYCRTLSLPMNRFAAAAGPAVAASAQAATPRAAGSRRVCMGRTISAGHHAPVKRASRVHERQELGNAGDLEGAGGGF